MVYAIDRRYPVVWRSPSCLQIGVDRAVCVFLRVRPLEEKIIAALIRGISRGGLELIARSCGENLDALDALLRRLAPVLSKTSSSVTAAPRQVMLDGAGTTIETLAIFLRAAGIGVTSLPEYQRGAEREELPRPDLVVIAAHFVIEPHRHELWLRRDVPHLPIIFGDQRITVGPLVEPGRTPCIRCLDLTRLDIDAAWIAIASQLAGRQAASEIPRLSWKSAMIAAHIVVDRFISPSFLGSNASGDSRGVAHPPAARIIRVEVPSGVLSQSSAESHPSCGCLILEGTVNLPVGSGNR